MEPFRLYRVGVADMVMWLATFGATLFMSVKEGIIVGMAVSAFTLIQRWVYCGCSFTCYTKCLVSGTLCTRRVSVLLKTLNVCVC